VSAAAKAARLPPGIKGTGSSDGLRYFLYVWTDEGINKGRWWFLNF
jgi:hypothetical protein